MVASPEHITTSQFEQIIKKLNELAMRNTGFYMEELPIEIMPSFQDFIVGNTVLVKDGKPYVHYRDFIAYYRMIWKMK